MQKIKFVFWLIFCLSCLSAFIYPQNVPFPRAMSYAGCIKPGNATQTQMNNTVGAYFDYWKGQYVRQSSGVTPGGGYYVNMKGTGGTGNEITTSEAHGWGMVIFALMAGHDPAAKSYFDGFYNMYDKHRSTIDNDLMSWIIDQSEQTSQDSDSATDGDMDIAYALLLAHDQWGSGGAINYLAEARRIITNGIRVSEMDNAGTKLPLLGDWAAGDYAQWGTRSSDWMTDHFAAYYTATGDAFWTGAKQAVYSAISAISRNYSQTTGLMPDFVVGTNPAPAPPNHLEADTDDDFSWNACRFPFRIAMDYAHYGSADAKNTLNKILTWIKGATGNNPGSIKAGYTLSGNALVSYSSAAFTAPMVAASIVDTAHQQYLNTGWNLLVNDKSDYYGDTINLLCMLLISGNWWAPGEAGQSPDKGNVNGDGAVDIIDALMTAQYYVGLNPPNFNPGAADVNGDSAVTIVDALMIAQYYVGLITW